MCHPMCCAPHTAVAVASAVTTLLCLVKVQVPVVIAPGMMSSPTLRRWRIFTRVEISCKRAQTHWEASKYPASLSTAAMTWRATASTVGGGNGHLLKDCQDV